MPNIEVFNRDDYKIDYASKLDEIRSLYITTQSEIEGYLRQINSDPVGLSGGEAFGVVGSTAAKWGTAGAVAGGFIGGGVGAGIGFGIGWIGGLIFGAGKVERVEEAALRRRNLSENQYQGMFRKSRSVYNLLTKKLDASRDRFRILSGVDEEKKRLKRTQAMKAKEALAITRQRERLDYEKELTNLDRREKVNSVRFDNAIRNIKNTKNLFLVSKDAMYEKYKIEKQSLDTQLNVLTSKYYLADLTKDMQSIAIAKHKQDRFLQGVIPSSQGLSSSLNELKGSLSSLKQMSDSISVSNAIEQTEAKLMLQYKKTVNDLVAKESILAARRGSLGQSYRTDIRQLSARMAKTLGELDGQRLGYKAELEGIALQRQVLYNTFEERSNLFDSRMALIDAELESTLRLIDYDTAAKVGRETETYNTLLENAKQFFIETQTLAERIYESGELQEITLQGQRFDQMFRDITSSINSIAQLNRGPKAASPSSTPTLKSGGV